MPSASIIPTGCCSRCVRKGAKGSGEFDADLLGRRARPRRREIPRGRAALRQRERSGPTTTPARWAWCMRDGINRLRHAKKYSGFFIDHLHQPGLDRLRRRAPAGSPAPTRARWRSPTGRDLGHQRGQHAGQRDDPRGARPQGARRQDRRRRHLHERHHGAGRPAGAGQARHRRRARLRGHALLFRDGLADRDYLDKYTDAPRELGSASAHAHAAMGGGDHRLPGRRDRGVRAAGRRATKRTFFRLGYGFCAPAQRRRSTCMRRRCIAAVTGAWQHEGGGAFHNNAASTTGTRSMHRRPRRARSDRCACSTSRASAPVLTGDHDALCDGPPVTAMLIQNTNPVSVAPGAGDGQARLCARRSVHLRARAVHDRDGADGRRRAAGDHVPGARRRLSGRRPPAHHARAEADRAAGRVPLQPRGDLRAGQAARRASIRAST